MSPFTDLFISPLLDLPISPSDALRKMLSPQMIGVEPLQAGISNFHVTFSSTVHLTGRFFSLLMPLSAGPRHCGQLSAETMFSAATVDRAMMTNTSVNRRRMSFLRKSLGTRRFHRAVAYGRPTVGPQGLGAECAGLQAIITRRKFGDFGGV